MLVGCGFRVVDRGMWAVVCASLGLVLAVAALVSGARVVDCGRGNGVGRAVKIAGPLVWRDLGAAVMDQL